MHAQVVLLRALMVRPRFLPGRAQIYLCLVLFVGYAGAALQNVTVDDAVSAGVVVPQYFPPTLWNIGNNCTGCLVKPDPSLAYNRTWHDATFSANNGYTQSIEFSYTGSSLYIFFILANTVPYATTNTNVDFVLDGVLVGTYNHTPSTSTDYQYNVPVYANSSVAFGEHSMIIQPVITSESNVLILFDYLIYTTDTSSSVLPFTTITSTSSPTPGTITTIVSPISTSSMAQGTYSRPIIRAIAGGTVGGFVAVILVATLLLCYRRYKRRSDGLPPAEGDVADPFIISHEAASTSLAGTTSSIYPVGVSAAVPTSRSKTVVSPSILQRSNPPTSSAPSSPGAPVNDNASLLEQVGLLRGEVARLRNMHVANQDSIGLPLEAPPEYSS